MFRYAIVSVVSTVFGFAVLGIVFGALHLWTEVPTAIFANVMGIVPLYYLNRSWVWEKTGSSHWRREVLPFWKWHAISASPTISAIPRQQRSCLRSPSPSSGSCGCSSSLSSAGCSEWRHLKQPTPI
jgi:hypothetical protein